MLRGSELLNHLPGFLDRLAAEKSETTVLQYSTVLRRLAKVIEPESEINPEVFTDFHATLTPTLRIRLSAAWNAFIQDFTATVRPLPEFEKKKKPGMKQPKNPLCLPLAIFCDLWCGNTKVIAGSIATLTWAKPPELPKGEDSQAIYLNRREIIHWALSFLRAWGYPDAPPEPSDLIFPAHPRSKVPMTLAYFQAQSRQIYPAPFLRGHFTGIYPTYTHAEDGRYIFTTPYAWEISHDAVGILYRQYLAKRGKLYLTPAELQLFADEDARDAECRRQSRLRREQAQQQQQQRPQLKLEPEPVPIALPDLPLMEREPDE